MLLRLLQGLARVCKMETKNVRVRANVSIQIPPNVSSVTRRLAEVKRKLIMLSIQLQRNTLCHTVPEHIPRTSQQHHYHHHSGQSGLHAKQMGNSNVS